MSNENWRKTLLTFDHLVQMEVKGNGEVMASQLGVSRRTFFRLLTYMRRELNAPLVYNEKEKRYCYTNKGSIVLNFVHASASQSFHQIEEEDQIPIDRQNLL